ncbi:MAG: FliI/YscN family ATPase [Planctomycetota bacterium]
MTTLAAQLDLLDAATAQELRGVVSDVRGLVVQAEGLPVPVGTSVRFCPKRGGAPRGVPGQVVGCADGLCQIMPLGSTAGLARGDAVTAEHADATVRVGASLLGRVLNGLGEPIDGKGPLGDTHPHPLEAPPIAALDRKPIERPLATGVRVIDALSPLGRGQRLGVFASPGVGKSTLLAQCAKQTAADVSVIALIGERGREVRDFLERTLGPGGLARSVVVVATSDEPALLRLRAARLATAVAESFRAAHRHVLLVLDSITRFCQAQRQVGLSIGEPPTTRGYPPSVFAALPELMERAGQTETGSITALYAVLVEGDDMDEPIADACRGILDGHLLLSRKLAERGHYPAVDAPGSISRVADDVTDKTHRDARRHVLKLLADHAEVEDLVNIGAYAAGSNPDYDLAIAAKPVLDQFLVQTETPTGPAANFATTRAQLLALCEGVRNTQSQLQAQLAKRPRPGPPASR